jgi:hypothetical protein
MTFRASEQVLRALGVCATIAVCTLCFANSTAQSQIQAERYASPIYGIKIPPGYRDWQLVSVKRLTGAGGNLKQLRAELANDIATTAFREGRLRFPDGSVIAALHWNEASSLTID